MKNVDYKIDGNKLIITMDITKDFGLSKSEKSIIIASTEGNQKIVTDKNGIMFLGLNLYKYPPRE